MHADRAIYREKVEIEKEKTKVTDTLIDARLNKDTQPLEPAPSNQSSNNELPDKNSSNR